MEELLKLQKPRLPNKSEHPYHMYDMITGTPDALKRVWEEEQSVIDRIVDVLHSSRINKILFVGIGTSWHATLNAQYFLSKGVADLDGLTDKTVTAWNSFEFVQQQPKLDSHTAVFIYSHRGVKTYSYQSMVRSREAGSYTVLITGVEAASNGLADEIIRTSKSEQSSAFTISHNCSTFISLILATKLGVKLGSKSALEIQTHLLKIPQYYSDVIADVSPYKRWAALVKDRQYLPFVGYKGNVSNCYEVALKIKEASYVVAEGCQIEQFIHGPFVSLDINAALTTIITPDEIGFNRSIQLLKAAKHVGAIVTAITTKSDTLTETIIGADNIIKLIDVPEPITVITNLAVLQLLTYFLALEKKTNPDTFRRDTPLHCDAFSSTGLLL